ncbi:unnamed protein product, partial [Oppiella nova]
MLLLMAYYPELQNKLQDEIARVLGDSMPHVNDQSRLPYVLAYISETLRYRSPLAFTLPHRALDHVQFGIRYNIPTDTMVIVNLNSMLMDENVWSQPKKFNPDRFLNAHGDFCKINANAFMPFGTGRRICVGEQLGMNDLFVTLVRFLQLTKDYRIELASDRFTIEPDPKGLIFQFPSDFEVVLH